MPPSTQPSISQFAFPSLLEVRTPTVFYLGEKNKTKLRFWSVLFRLFGCQTCPRGKAKRVATLLGGPNLVKTKNLLFEGELILQAPHILNANELNSWRLHQSCPPELQALQTRHGRLGAGERSMAPGKPMTQSRVHGKQRDDKQTGGSQLCHLLSNMTHLPRLQFS